MLALHARISSCMDRATAQILTRLSAISVQCPAPTLPPCRWAATTRSFTARSPPALRSLSRGSSAAGTPETDTPPTAAAVSRLLLSFSIQQSQKESPSQCSFNTSLAAGWMQPLHDARRLLSDFDGRDSNLHAKQMRRLLLQGDYLQPWRIAPIVPGHVALADHNVNNTGLLWKCWAHKAHRIARVGGHSCWAALMCPFVFRR